MSQDGGSRHLTAASTFKRSSGTRKDDIQRGEYDYPVLFVLLLVIFNFYFI